MRRLDWVDEYIERTRPYVFVRVEDRTLIKRPNLAWRMNEAAIRILDRLYNGNEKIEAIAAEAPDREQALRDLDVFFRDLRLLLTSGLPDAYESPAVRVVPFEAPFSPLPVLAEFAITYRCNLRCRFCYAGGPCSAPPNACAEEVSTEEARRAIDLLWREARAPSLSFTGGEPTLREDLEDLTAHARGLGFRVNLITNGTLLDGARARRLAGAGLSSAQVSLEASEPAIHDALTGAEGSFEASLAGVEALRAAGLRVHTNTTLNRLNLEDAPRLPALARRLGLERLSMNLMIPTGAGRNAADLVVTYSEVGPRVDAIRAAARREGVEFHWYSPTPLCLFNPIARGLGNKSCAACDGLASLAPNGDLLPCSSYDEPVGNVLREGFRAVWNSPRARFFREKRYAAPVCRACESFAACQGACPLYWRAMGCAELPASPPGARSGNATAAGTSAGAGAQGAADYRSA